LVEIAFKRTQLTIAVPPKGEGQGEGNAPLNFSAATDLFKCSKARAPLFISLVPETAKELRKPF
jgi:hypothetical protein